MSTNEQRGITVSLGLLGVALGALGVIAIALASQPRRCTGGPARLGGLLWTCVAVGALSAFLSPIIGGNLRGWRAAGSVFAGRALAAVWIVATLVIGIYFDPPAECFD